MPSRTVIAVLAAAMISSLNCGCGSTKNRLATDQLLASDAVDRAVSKIDFRSLSGQTVFLDTQYLKSDPKRGIGYVDGDYVISSLRQQITAAGCLMKESVGDAEFVIEARLGALGIDDREVVYGLPASNALKAAADAAAAVSAAPSAIPSIPEMSIARREDHAAAAKISCFAYHRETREPVWQSGLAIAKSKAKDTYILGAGPFQKGEIYKGVRFAGEDLKSTFIPYGGGKSNPVRIAISEPHLFIAPDQAGAVEPEILPAGHEETPPDLAPDSAK